MKNLLYAIAMTVFLTTSMAKNPFWFVLSTSEAAGLPAIYLASQTMDFSKHPEVTKAILTGDVILFDGGHTSYTLTLPYRYKDELKTTTFNLRRHGILFGLSHTDDSDRTTLPNNLQSTIPFRLSHRIKDRFKLEVAKDIVKDDEMQKGIKAVKLSKDGFFAKNKYKFKLGVLRMIKEANDLEGQQVENFQEVYSE